MFSLNLQRWGMLVGVGVAHAAAAFALSQMHRTDRAQAPLVVMETQFFPAIDPHEEPAKPVVQIQPVALHIDASAPELSVENAALLDAPPSATAPTAIASSVPLTNAIGPVVVESVQYVEAPRPRYPALSRRLKEQGVVVLKVLVNEHGEAQRIEIADSSGHERLDQAAVEAVASATFRPLLENGVPRAMLVLIPIEFGLRRMRT